MLTSYCRECANRKMREWRRDALPRTEEQKRRERARAYANVYQRRGKLIPQPCRVCGDPKAEKHHHDYSKPLEVEWLCRSCHRNLHDDEPTRRGPYRTKRPTIWDLMRQK